MTFKQAFQNYHSQLICSLRSSLLDIKCVIKAASDVEIPESQESELLNFIRDYNYKCDEFRWSNPGLYSISNETRIILESIQAINNINYNIEPFELASKQVLEAFEKITDLLEKSYPGVQIESNGTYRMTMNKVTLKFISCSPSTTNLDDRIRKSSIHQLALDLPEAIDCEIETEFHINAKTNYESEGSITITF